MKKEKHKKVVLPTFQSSAEIPNNKIVLERATSNSKYFSHMKGHFKKIGRKLVV